MKTDQLDRRKRRAADARGTLERRVFADAGLELRERSDGVIRLSGWASVFDSPYEVSGWTETVQRGAFKRSIGELPDVVLLANHTGLPLARTRSAKGGPGTLVLSEDDTGLRFEAEMDALDLDAQQLARKINRGDLSSCSMAFRARSDAWDDQHEHRTLLDCGLHGGDVSVVSMAANESTSVAVRARSNGRPLVLDFTPRAQLDLLRLGWKPRSRRRAASVERQQLEAARRSTTRRSK